MIVDVIGSRGYLDTGIRIRTDGTPDINEFIIVDGVFHWSNGTGAADNDKDHGVEIITISNAGTAYRVSGAPVDKAGVYLIQANSETVSSAGYEFTYYDVVFYAGAAAVSTIYEMCNHHGLIKLKTSVNAQTVVSRGYKI